MKILYYIDSHDSRIDSIIDIIKLCGYPIGYLSELDEKSIFEFAPDLIIHNIAGQETFPIKGNFTSINFNETNSPRSFTFTNDSSSGYIHPFVSLKSVTVHDHEIDKYSSDILYFGSPIVFGNAINIAYEKELRFKFFHQQPHNMYGYCGLCNTNDYFKYYRYSKASIVKGWDVARLQDIIVAGGNPVVLHDDSIEKSTEFTQNLNDAIFEGKRYTIDNMSRDDILENNTVFDACNKIFKRIGLNQVCIKTMKLKSEMIGQYK